MWYHKKVIKKYVENHVNFFMKTHVVSEQQHQFFKKSILFFIEKKINIVFGKINVVNKK